MRVFVFALLAVGAALAVPAVYQTFPDLVAAVLGSAPNARTAPQSTGASDGDHSASGPLSGRKVAIAAGRGGHFSAEFRLNGRSVPALVDTGATLVAINASTARRIGLKLSPADFKHRVSTANGETKAAAARLDRVQIGRIDLEDVDVAVLDDSALSGVLIGMSFLNRLSHYSVEDGALVLEQ